MTMTTKLKVNTKARCPASLPVTNCFLLFKISLEFTVRLNYSKQNGLRKFSQQFYLVTMDMYSVLT